MRKPNLYLTLVAMVAMITVSLGVSSAAYGVGFDKTKNKRYASLESVNKKNINTIYNNSNNKSTNNKKYISNNKKVSNKVTNLLDKNLNKNFIQDRSATVLTYHYVHSRASRAGWGTMQWKCLSKIIYRESRWHVNSKNKHSSAYGLFQILNLPEGTPIRVQVEKGIKYIRERYDDPCSALKHHDYHGWY